MTLALFGLTGGIGSGKSTVARRFRDRGLPVIDADALAREVVEPGTEGLAEIVAEFGADVLDERGHLDRKKVAARVFSDDGARKRLNAITHPRIAHLFAARSRELEASAEPLACYEVPLLFEGRLAEMLRPIVLVTAKVDDQVARAMQRDGSTDHEVRARVRAQMPLSEKEKLADHIIDNSGSLEDTLARADEVLDAVCLHFGLDPERYPR